MPSDKTKKGLLVGGILAAALLLGTAGTAKADEIIPPDDDIPEPPPKPEPGELTSNWGGFPEGLRGPFLEAEKAARLPGMGRFMAVWAWGAFRAKKAFVSPSVAAEIAKSNPDLCRTCVNPGDAKWSRMALENVVLPLGESGQFGTGKYKKPWPKPHDWGAWADVGSVGLFDLLAGAQVHQGIHDGFISPILEHGPDVLFNTRVQLYIAGVLVHRILNSPLYKVLSPSAAETWSRVRAVTSSPAQFVAWQKGDKENEIAVTAMENFIGRAKELGIDLQKVANPTLTDVKAWPGAQAYYEALEVGL